MRYQCSPREEGGCSKVFEVGLEDTNFENHLTSIDPMPVNYVKIEESSKRELGNSGR
jgi:hypothetical protein